MSAQFGRWNLDGKPVDSAYIEKVKESLSPYGPDGGTSCTRVNVAILYHVFRTTKESRCEVQPHVCSSGTVITWDGRLDNRTDLIGELCDPLTVNSADGAIVAAAFEKWGTNCFGKLKGDWAFSAWDPIERALILAKDPIGTRHLHYSFDEAQISWSTLLDPLIRLAGRNFELNEEYIAGWLSMFPATHLTPCRGIHSVPPSSFVLIRAGKHVVNKYWDFDSGKRIYYHRDWEYEEHFRTVFATAIRRRLRSETPVLAELSGGRDSSSIVCMADEIIKHGMGETPRLDTISYFDDSEPNWDERPFFTKVEEKRGHTGCHINLNCLPDGQMTSSEEDLKSSPPLDRRSSLQQFYGCLTSQGNRVVISGIGGDEVMGGMPTPIPELQDLVVTAKLCRLAHQLRAWALQLRKPWFSLLCGTVRGFLPDILSGPASTACLLPWLQIGFIKRHRAAICGYPHRLEFFGLLPSFQHNLAGLESLRREFTHKSPPFPFYEVRYPYLDLDLLEFMYAIPREQVVRPASRRSLMRRALVGIVPNEILNRKGKAFIARSPLVEIARRWGDFSKASVTTLSSALGIVDSGILLRFLQKARNGEEIPLAGLTRTLSIEARLRHLHGLGVVNFTTCD